MDGELLASHVDALYGVAREEFTAERERRTKELRAGGHREEAAALKGHRKPTVPAWAVDQLARREASRVAELLAAAEQLRDVQRVATSGRGSAGLREATRRLRTLVSQLRDVAGEIIEASGARPDSHLNEVGQTLFAAAVDPGHHEILRRGVLTAPLEATGFGGLDGMTVIAGSDAQQIESDEAGGDETDVDEDSAAEARRHRRAAQRRDLEQREAELRRSRHRVQRRAERAEANAEELRARADEAAADAGKQHAELARIDQELSSLCAELETLDE